MANNNATISFTGTLSPIAMLTISVLAYIRTNNLSELHPA